MSIPGPNQEYFIYQTLLGAWPLDPNEMGSFRERVQKVLVKSWRESKLYTSWSDPDTEYENAVAEFVDTILTPVAENHFLPDFIKFQSRVAAAGACVSLANTLLRLTAPGIPDIYNGAELWELSLVDPDNRRPVNFATRSAELEGLAGRGIPDLLANWQCGAVKQYVIQQTLNLRRHQPEVFRAGEYIPVEVVGPQADRVIAFARHAGMAWSIVVAVRFPAKLVRAQGLSLDKRSLANVEVTFPVSGPRRWSNLFAGKNLEVPAGGRVAVSHILGSFPVALLSALPD
jgi:(1->4)-alpha-D-glucan 1-alpha-D-glucosylmutase